jgi:hypothetical protein
LASVPKVKINNKANVTWPTERKSFFVIIIAIPVVLGARIIPATPPNPVILSAESKNPVLACAKVNAERYSHDSPDDWFKIP